MKISFLISGGNLDQRGDWSCGREFDGWMARRPRRSLRRLARRHLLFSNLSAAILGGFSQLRYRAELAGVTAVRERTNAVLTGLRESDPWRRLQSQRGSLPGRERACRCGSIWQTRCRCRCSCSRSRQCGVSVCEQAAPRRGRALALWHCGGRAGQGRVGPPLFRRQTNGGIQCSLRLHLSLIMIAPHCFDRGPTPGRHAGEALVVCSWAAPISARNVQAAEIATGLQRITATAKPYTRLRTTTRTLNMVAAERSATTPGPAGRAE